MQLRQDLAAARVQTTIPSFVHGRNDGSGNSISPPNVWTPATAPMSTTQTGLWHSGGSRNPPGVASSANMTDGQVKLYGFTNPPLERPL